jgi:hypothetical protein
VIGKKKKEEVNLPEKPELTRLEGQELIVVEGALRRLSAIGRTLYAVLAVAVLGAIFLAKQDFRLAQVEESVQVIQKELLKDLATRVRVLESGGAPVLSAPAKESDAKLEAMIEKLDSRVTELERSKR